MLQEAREPLLRLTHELQALGGQHRVEKAGLLLVPIKVPADPMRLLLPLEQELVHKVPHNKQQDVVTRLLIVKQKATTDLFTIGLLTPEHLRNQEVVKAQELFKV